MVSDLTIAGLVEARVWQSAAPWLDSVRAARPFWSIRTLLRDSDFAGIHGAARGPDHRDVGAGLRAVEDSVGLEPVKHIAPRLAPP